MDVADKFPLSNLTLDDELLFVCKTDTQGLLTYASKLFQSFNNYAESDLLGKSIEELLDPRMPFSMRNYIWSELSAAREVFVYLKYRTKSGQSYWTFSNITPGYSTSGEIKEYFFAQRKPSEQALLVIEPLYEEMCEKEAVTSDNNESLTASFNLLQEAISQLGGNYEEFILGL